MSPLSPRRAAPPATRLQKIAAFAAVYLVWGSTYLAIRIGVHAEQWPPALFAGLRFVAAGLLLGTYARWRGQQFPRAVREWVTIAVVGLLLMAGGNGLVVVGEQWVASNVAALIVASVALWIAGFGALGAQGEMLNARAKLGLGVGFGGVALLLAPHGAGATLHGEWIIVAACVFWAAGTVFGRRRKPTTPPLMSAALQMFVGGVFLCLVGLAAGESAHVTWTWTGIAALAYLIVFGSCVAYAAYVWLMHVVPPALLGTYAYVNPVIAALLGWAFLGEAWAPTRVLAMLVILAGVALVASAGKVRETEPG